MLNGCGSSSPTAAGDAADAPRVGAASCSADPRVQPAAAGAVATGSRLDFRLVTASPSTPTRGNNTWTFHVADKGGKPQPGLKVAVSTWMPDHRHASSVIPTVVDRGDGSYDVTTIYLFMPGVWELHFDVSAPAVDRAVYTICLTN